MTSLRNHSTRIGSWLPTTLVAGVLLASACSGTVAERPTETDQPWQLMSFDSCEAATQGLRAAAQAHVGPRGFTGPVNAAASGQGRAAATDPPLDEPPTDRMAPEPAQLDGGTGQAATRVQATQERAAGQPAAPLMPGQPAHSGTNVHEAGVEEPDLIKTDGRRIVTVADGMLRVVDAQHKRDIGTLSLLDQEAGHQPQATELLLHGDQALVLLGGQPELGAPPMPMPRPGALSERLPSPVSGPRLLLVDLSGPPEIRSEYTIDGALVDARAVGKTAQVVVRSSPRFDFPRLYRDAPDQDRLEANQNTIAAADITDWLPRYELTVDGSTHTGQGDCTAVRHPASYSGTSMLTVLTFDLTATTLSEGDPVSIIADGETVYSSGDSLYVAHDQRGPALPGPGDDPWPQARTEIYKFDTSQPGPPRYVAAGTVEGWLINQYALSEWEGQLRVATTTGDVWGRGDGEPDSESAVYVLAQHEDKLVQTGMVGGLGKGERIYAVRYAGPVGYVVTFRETDPLYTVDLSDPADPTVLGELKITGYSSHLHPVDDGYLIGVGQEADLQGVVQGTQVSLFDVSDLTDPRLRDHHHVPRGHSEAELDPHALLWWPPEQLLVLPLAVPHGPGDGVQGALVLQVVDGGLTKQALVSHPDNQWAGATQIRRSLVIDNILWTFSAAGLQANDLASMSVVAWLPFD